VAAADGFVPLREEALAAHDDEVVHRRGVLFWGSGRFLLLMIEVNIQPVASCQGYGDQNLWPRRNGSAVHFVLTTATKVVLCSIM
jgi:hypothetical protein